MNKYQFDYLLYLCTSGLNNLENETEVQTLFYNEYFNERKDIEKYENL